MRWRRAFLTGFSLGFLSWSIVEARLTFGAVPTRLTLLFDGT